MGLAEKLAEDFLSHLDSLRKNKGSEITIGDIDGLFKHLRSEQRDAVYDGIRGIAEKISTVKVEIFSPSPDEITSDIIPDANMELGAVVSAAENATNQILDSVEIIQNVSSALNEEDSAKVLHEVTKIFEACNFQDVSGQRISKVVKTLEDIDSCVAEILEAISGKVELEKKERTNKIGDAALMTGPQLEEVAPSQEEIDKLFADA